MTQSTPSAIPTCCTCKALNGGACFTSEGREAGHLLAEVVQEGGHNLLLLQQAGLELRARLAGCQKCTRCISGLICICSSHLHSPTLHHPSNQAAPLVNHAGR